MFDKEYIDIFSVIGWLHVYPVNDWIEHKLKGIDCMCEPKLIGI